tara:strand:- start:1156 stop:1392 length:237 start_codon:yes stop_codon:yes gene_type:complete
VGLLGLKESKTNPNATGWSVIRRAIVNAFVCGLSALIVLTLKGTLEENWGWVINSLSLVHLLVRFGNGRMVTILINIF